MKLTDSMAAKVALMLCMPLIFEVSVISTSLVLIDQIDAARVEKRKIGRVVYDYVDTLAAMISNYTSAAAAMEGKERANRDKVNEKFAHAQAGMNNLFKSCTENGIPCKDIRRFVAEKRRLYTEGRNAPSDITRAQMQKRTEARETMLVAIAMVDKRVMGRVNKLREAEASERALFLRMSGLLFLAFVVSVLLTIGLCLVISRVITERLESIRANTVRLANGAQLLPPLHGNDEIAKLDRNFHAMANALVAAELRNQLILENSIDVICALDREMHFVRLSDSCENFWEISQTELVGRPLTDLIPLEHQLAIIHTFDEARESLTVKNFEAITVSSSGQQVPCFWSIQWSEKDELFTCIAHNNTERKSAEARRQDLLAVISHDLRSPLTAARLSLEMLQHDKGLADQGKYLNSASASVNYVITVTNDLIDLLRIQQSRLSFELKLSTIGQVKELVQKQMKSQGVEVELDVALANATYLMLDEDQMPRLLVTLARHTQIVCGDVPVSITVAAARTRGSEPEADQSEQIVFRVEPLRYKKVASTARIMSAQRISSEISLALCHEIAERLHGQLFTSWTPQGQPTYELRLPAVAVG